MGNKYTTNGALNQVTVSVTSGRFCVKGKVSRTHTPTKTVLVKVKVSQCTRFKITPANKRPTAKAPAKTAPAYMPMLAGTFKTS